MPVHFGYMFSDTYWLPIAVLLPVDSAARNSQDSRASDWRSLGERIRDRSRILYAGQVVIIPVL